MSSKVVGWFSCSFAIITWMAYWATARETETGVKKLRKKNELERSWEKDGKNELESYGMILMQLFKITWMAYWATARETERVSAATSDLNMSKLDSPDRILRNFLLHNNRFVGFASGWRSCPEQWQRARLMRHGSRERPWSSRIRPKSRKNWKLMAFCPIFLSV